MRLSESRHLAFALALVAAVAAAPAGATEEDAYLRGYVDAMLDSRFAGLGLRTKLATSDGHVTLAARACLGPAQKRDIEHLLGKTGHVVAIAWDESTDCDAPRAAAAAETAPAKRRVEVRWLPEHELFAPLLADPRQPRFSMSYQYYNTPRDRFNAAAVAFGEYFGLTEGFLGDYGSSQLGIQGAVFALFNLEAPSSDLVNADYWIGLPLSYRRGPWSFLLRAYHQSSHLGDEFILGSPGVNRVNLSYEDLQALVSYEWERWRAYGGAGYLLHSDPDLKRKHLQGGVEYVRPHTLRDLDFIAALDIKASEELDWKSSLSYQAGFEFRGTSQRRLRLVLEYFEGHSPNGQFYRERLRYTGLGLYFGF